LSEYKKQIGVGLSLALVAGLLVAIFAYSFFPAGEQTTTLVASTTITEASRTTPMPTFPSGAPTVSLDPALKVNVTNPVLLSDNATQIAEWAASLLGEAPATLQSEIPPSGPNNTILAYQAIYDFRTAAGSEVVITYLYGQFYELEYRISGTAANPPTITNATRFADQLLSGPGLPVQNLTFQSQVTSPGPGFTDIQLVQKLQGLPFAGTLAANFDGSHYVEEGTVEVLIGPTDDHLNRLFLFTPYWYAIPQSFPLVVGPSQAAGAALASIPNSNQSGFVANVSFAGVSGHLYFLVEASNYQVSYYVFVNPRTGAVGFPTP